jgi:uncharacterized protein YkwD
MRNKRPSKKHIIILFFSLFMLLGGLVIALSQTSVQQDNRTLAAGDCTVNAEQMQIKQQEQTLFDLVNNYRTQNGKTAMTWSATLKRPAAWLSKDMLTTRNLSHTDSLNRLPEQRLPDCGFPITANYGENVASGAPSAREVFDAWVASPPHNQIMLNASFTQGAVGMEVDTTGEVAFWTLDVAEGANTGPTATTGPTSTIPTGTIPTGIPSSPSGTPTIILTPVVTTKPTTVPKDPTPTTGPIGVDVQISVKVKILGIGSDGNPTPKQLTRRVTAKVFGVGKNPLATGNAFLTYDNQGYFTGIIRLGKLNQGSYFVKISTDNSLETLARPEFQNLMIDRINPIPPVTLYQGDITRDNVLDIDDYNAVLPCFQDKRCDSQKEIDFNDDGVTDVKDYNLLLRSFGQQPGN